MGVQEFFHLPVFLSMLVSFDSVVTQCHRNTREVSILGKMLQKHIFKTITGAAFGDVCLRECYRDVRCQSFNYVFTQNKCELSNRTKEARPEDFVPNSERYYFRRDRKRAILGAIPELSADSCKEIKASEGGQAVSGKYWLNFIKPDTPVLAHCDMKTEDIDECAQDTHNCSRDNATCTNTEGLFNCSCNPGFSGDGHNCADIDEYAGDTYNCSKNNSTSANTEGSFNCSCKQGFTGNGHKCEGGLASSSILNNSPKYYNGTLSSYLDPVLTNPSSSQFIRCYHAKTDGWDSTTFHSKCDGKGPTVSIIQVGNYTFGGYTDVSRQSSCGYTTAAKAFIFSLYNVHGYKPITLAQYRYQGYAIYRCNSYGPTFGGYQGQHDIYLQNNARKIQKSLTICGSTYAVPTGYTAFSKCVFFSGSELFTPTDLEVFYEITS